MVTTAEVFGVNRNLPLNYVVRESADGQLIQSLARGEHLVIFGSSKQGKTCLRKRNISDGKVVAVNCSNKWQLADLHSAILKQAGFELTQSTSKATTGKAKIFAKISAKLFGSGTDGGIEGEHTSSSQKTTTPLELDPEDVNDVIKALDSVKFSKFIILDDFHYLPVETQQDFAVALKAFHEESNHCFVIVGVWLDENRITDYNGDLAGRIVSINADKWEDKELRKVISQGESLLGIRFRPAFVDQLLRECAGSVYIVQEACSQCCFSAGIHKTQPKLIEIGSTAIAQEIVSQIVEDQSSRYHRLMSQFADGPQNATLEIYRWLLLPIIHFKADKLRHGISLLEIKKLIIRFHPMGREIKSSDLDSTLESVAALQAERRIRPIVLDYDRTGQRLRVVDSGFLIWLQLQTAKELLAASGLKLKARPGSSSWLD